VEAKAVIERRTTSLGGHKFSCLAGRQRWTAGSRSPHLADEVGPIHGGYIGAVLEVPSPQVDCVVTAWTLVLTERASREVVNIINNDEYTHYLPFLHSSRLDVGMFKLPMLLVNNGVWVHTWPRISSYETSRSFFYWSHQGCFRDEVERLLQRIFE